MTLDFLTRQPVRESDSMKARTMQAAAKSERA